MPLSPDPSRRHALRVITAVVVGTITGLNADDVIHEHSALGVTRQTLPLQDWPAALDGLTIGVLTDLHRSETVSRDLVERAVDALLELRPDLVVLGGDYVSFGARTYVDSVADSLSRLRAPGGVFATLGNHDDERFVPAALGAAGIHVLKDDRARITVSGHPLDLVGVKYWTRRLDDITGLVDQAQPARILLAHDPRRIREAATLGFPLVLAGHTHGGQVVLPGIGAIAARKFPLAWGAGLRDRTTMFVSRGVGTVYIPVRYRCPPEVALLTLRSAAPGDLPLPRI